LAISKPSAEDVRAIIATTMTDPQVSAVIDDAALLAEDCISSLSSARQASIVKWLTAHMIASTGGSASRTSKKLGDAAETYAVAQLGEGLRGTTYGQQALALDPNGCLANLGKRGVVFETL